MKQHDRLIIPIWMDEWLFGGRGHFMCPVFQYLWMSKVGSQWQLAGNQQGIPNVLLLSWSFHFFNQEAYQPHAVTTLTSYFRHGGPATLLQAPSICPSSSPSLIMSPRYLKSLTTSTLSPNWEGALCFPATMASDLEELTLFPAVSLSAANCSGAEGHAQNEDNRTT